MRLKSMPIEEWLNQADRLYGAAVASMESPVLGITLAPRCINVDAELLRQFIDIYAAPLRQMNNEEGEKNIIYPSLMTYMRSLFNIQPHQILQLTLAAFEEKNSIYQDLDLSYCDFRGCQFGSTKQGVVFINCTFKNSVFRNCDLSRVRFEQCVLDESDWRGARAGEVQLVYDGQHGMRIKKLITHVVDLERAKTYGILPLGIVLEQTVQDMLYQIHSPQSVAAIAQRVLRRIDASCLHAYISDLSNGIIAPNTPFNAYVADFYDIQKSGHGKQAIIADLRGMDFSDEAIDVAEANFTQVIASGANFRGCHLPRSQWYGACLEGADFSYANLEGSNLNEINGNYIKAISTNLQRVQLQHAHCERGVFIGANLSHASLRYSHMASADMTEVQASYANFDHMDAPYLTAYKGNFSRANLFQAQLSGADLRYADLSWAMLSRACLAQANCTHSMLINATLEKADASYANFSDTMMESTNFENSVLSHTILNQVCARYANFSNADVSYAQCNQAVFSYANFSKARAEGIRCYDVLMNNMQGPEMVLDYAVLRYVNGENMQLRHASLKGIEWMHSHLTNSDLSNCNSERGVWCQNRMHGSNLSGLYIIDGKWRHNHCHYTQCHKIIVDHTTRLCANNWRQAAGAENILQYQRQWHANHGCWRHWLFGWMYKKQQA